MAICLLSLAAGLALAFWAPVLQFAVGLVGLALVGAALSWALGAAPGAVLGWTALLYVCAQVGYGCGVAVIAVLQERRRTSAGAGSVGAVDKNPQVKSG